MSWEYEGDNLIITEKNIDELEKAYSSILVPGFHPDDYYIISSWNPDYPYGVCKASGFFNVIRALMKENSFGKYDKPGEKETLNHWRWYPSGSWHVNDEERRPQGGSLKHWYTSRDIDEKTGKLEDWSKLSDMNQNTQDSWNKLNSRIIKPPFYRGGDLFEKLGIGIKITDLWWCSNPGHINFSARTKEKIILEI